MDSTVAEDPQHTDECDDDARESCRGHVLPKEDCGGNYDECRIERVDEGSVHRSDVLRRRVQQVVVGDEPEQGREEYPAPRAGGVSPVGAFD